MPDYQLQRSEDGHAVLRHVPEKLTSYHLDWNDRGPTLTVPTEFYYRGFTMTDWDQVRVPPGFVQVDEWTNGYRQVFVNHAERAIFTYCEGDLDLTIDASEDEFRARLDSAEKFYREVA